MRACAHPRLPGCSRRAGLHRRPHGGRARRHRRARARRRAWSRRARCSGTQSRRSLWWSPSRRSWRRRRACAWRPRCVPRRCPCARCSSTRRARRGLAGGCAPRWDSAPPGAGHLTRGRPALPAERASEGTGHRAPGICLHRALHAAAAALNPTLPAAQVIQESATQSFLAQRRRDQQRALQLLREDPGLRRAPAPARAPRASAAGTPPRLCPPARRLRRWPPRGEA